MSRSSPAPQLQKLIASTVWSRIPDRTWCAMAERELRALLAVARAARAAQCDCAACACDETTTPLRRALSRLDAVSRGGRAARRKP